jgi:hypothetical protein
MHIKRQGFALLFALMAALSLAAAPVYGGDHKRDNSKSLVAGISSDRAASIARDSTGGRVLKVECCSTASGCATSPWMPGPARFADPKHGARRCEYW